MVMAGLSSVPMSRCSGDAVTLVVTASFVEQRTDQLVRGRLIVPAQDEVMPAARPLLGIRPAVRTKGAQHLRGNREGVGRLVPAVRGNDGWMSGGVPDGCRYRRPRPHGAHEFVLSKMPRSRYGT